MFNTIKYSTESEKQDYVREILALHFGLEVKHITFSECDYEEFILDFGNTSVPVEAITASSVTFRDSGVDDYTKCIGDNDVFFRLL
jgi:hypothetical protein